MRTIPIFDVGGISTVETGESRPDFIAFF